MPGVRRATVLASLRITIRKVMWDIAKLSVSVSLACREFDRDLNRKEEACAARHCGNRRAVGDSVAARSANERANVRLRNAFSVECARSEALRAIGTIDREGIILALELVDIIGQGRFAGREFRQ